MTLSTGDEAAPAPGRNPSEGGGPVELSTTGATLTGDLYLHTPPTKHAGGKSTRSSRIILESYTRSNTANNRSGDVMELRWRHPAAKAFIGWWDYTDPDNPVMKAWMGAHDEANDGGRPHRHFSIEVANAAGLMKTRLAIPYGEDHTNITTSSADFTVHRGTLRVARSRLEFAVDRNGAPADRRWTVEMSGAPNNDLVVSAHEDETGEARRVLRISRHTGEVRFEGQIRVQGDARFGAGRGPVLKDKVSDHLYRLSVVRGKLRLEKL